MGRSSPLPKHIKRIFLIQDEKITRIGLDLEVDSAQVIDASGKLVMPGGVDPHVHLDLPMFGTVSSDDHYTGHKAAAFGGTTTVMDFVVLEDQGFQYSVDLWMKKAEKAAIDYSFHMNLTQFNEKIAKEIPSLREMGIHNAQSVHRLQRTFADRRWQYLQSFAHRQRERHVGDGTLRKR